MSKTPANHYIDNKEFYQAMIEWKKLVVEAEESDDGRPPVTEYIGKCFLDIAEHLSYRPNENCLMYAHNFDPEKSKNPFSYFTQIIYYAFLRRIEKEKKQSYVKFKAMEMLDDGTIKNWYTKNHFEPDKKEEKEEKEDKPSSVEEDLTASEMLYKHFQLNNQDIEKFTPKKKKKKKKKTTIDSLLEEKTSEDSTDK